jgi:translin
MPQGLGEIADRLRTEMDVLHQARERALAEGRRIIQLSSKAIKHIQRREFDEADQLIASTKSIVDSTLSSLDGTPSVRFAAHFQDAVKEYAEAALLRAIISGNPLPTERELHLQPGAYLNGLCEAASECRRYALDSLRLGDETEARRLTLDMEDIYDELVTFDYPDSVTSNLRRSVDALRAVLERTQSDVTVTGVQMQLITKLDGVSQERDA